MTHHISLQLHGIHGNMTVLVESILIVASNSAYTTTVTASGNAWANLIESLV